MTLQLLDTTFGAGDSAKSGGDKINANFAELYGIAYAQLDTPLNRRVIVIADSFAYRHSFSSGKGVWNTDASGAGNRMMAMGELNWLRYLTQQGFDFDGTGNYGIIGQTSTQIAARLPAILDADPAATVLCWSSINGYLADNPNILAEEQAAMAAIVTACQARGRYLFLGTPAAGGDSTTAVFPNANMRRARCHMRRWMRDTYRAALGVTIVDMDPGYALPASGDGRAINGTVATVPPIHPSPAGAYARALRYLPAFNARFGQRPGLSAMTNTDSYDVNFNPGGSRNSNPALDSTGGTVGSGGSGDIASGWVGGNGGDTGHTRAYSKIAAAPNTGRPAQRIVLGGTMASNAEVSLLLMNLSGQVVGDRVRLAIEFDGWSGVQNVQAICAVINPNGAAADGGVADMHYLDASTADRPNNTNPVGPLPVTVGPGLMLTPPFVMTSATPRILLSARALNGAAIGGAIDVLSMSLLTA